MFVLSISRFVVLSMQSDTFAALLPRYCFGTDRYVRCVHTVSGGD